MKVVRGPAPPPPFAPVVITLETQQEASIVRYLLSDASDVRDKAIAATLEGHIYVGTGPALSRGEIDDVLQAFKTGLQNSSIRG